MRWFWIAVTLLGLGVAFITHSPGLLALGLLVCLIGMFCTVFTMAGERIQERSRSDAAMLTPEVLAQIRARAKAQQSAAARPADDAQLQPQLDETSR